MQGEVGKTAMYRLHVPEIVRYAGGCAFNVVVKILVTALLTTLAFPVWAGYFCAQLVVLVTGYLYHSTITFHPKPGGLKGRAVNFLHFTLSVSAFKAVDYLLVVIGVGFVSRSLEAHNLLTAWMRQGVVVGLILTVSGVIFFLRYFCYRIIFRDRTAKAQQL